MARKDHLKTNTGKAACAGRRTGNGREFFVAPYAEFAVSPVQCAKCRASKLFAFLSRDAAKQSAGSARVEADLAAGEWEPEPADAWKAADDALLARRLQK